jgi:hypothetical protein
MLSSIAVTSEPREGEGYTGDGMPSRNTKAGISRHHVATFGLRGLELLEVYKLLESVNWPYNGMQHADIKFN